MCCRVEVGDPRDGALQRGCGPPLSVSGTRWHPLLLTHPQAMTNQAWRWSVKEVRCGSRVVQVRGGLSTEEGSVSWEYVSQAGMQRVGSHSFSSPDAVGITVEDRRHSHETVHSGMRSKANEVRSEMLAVAQSTRRRGAVSLRLCKCNPPSSFWMTPPRPLSCAHANWACKPFQAQMHNSADASEDSPDHRLDVVTAPAAIQDLATSKGCASFTLTGLK